MIARFLSKVKPVESGCVEWAAGKTGAGYGNIYLSKGKWETAHRVAWELFVGPIPNGLWVLHRCDNPGCVNTDHLFLGTQADNMADMMSKGRGGHLSGESHPNRAKTHCQRGHPYDEENTYFHKKRRARHCRICRRDNLRAWQAKAKSARTQ